MRKFTVSLLGLVASLSVAASASADYTIRSLATGRCLGVRSANTAAGSDIVTYSCDGSLNQTWAGGTAWPSPNNMFAHILNRVNGASSTNRCLSVNTTNPYLAVNASCLNTSADTNNKGWWLDYAGMYTVPGIVGQVPCGTLKSKTDSSKYLTGSGGNLAQPYLSSQVGPSPIGPTQIWCPINI